MKLEEGQRMVMIGAPGPTRTRDHDAVLSGTECLRPHAQPDG